jgi:hypothetical protein
MKNKTLAIRLLSNNCGVSNFYIDPEGEGECAIGALALSAGIPRSYLEEHNNSLIKMLPKVANAIRKKFGLNIGEQVTIQMANDAYDDIDERRQAVIDAINSL